MYISAAVPSATRCTRALFQCIWSLVWKYKGTAFEVAAIILARCINWQLNPPASPWRGGSFVRLMQTIRSPVREVLGKALIYFLDLDTLIAEVEAQVYSRSLTHVIAYSVVEFAL